jgi:carbon-monoxide dehydrogenase small subunit
MTIQQVTLRVNGVEHSAATEVRRTLVDFLRDDLELTGTHVGCEHGVCGACTVLIDGEPVRSCLMLAVQANGSTIETIEGLGSPDDLSPLQQSFRASHGFQCGFCTPGFVMTTVALLRENPHPTEDEIRHSLSGNICRCTGYQSIVEGVKLAAEAGLGRNEEVLR